MNDSAPRALELDVGAVLVPEVRVAGTIASTAFKTRAGQGGGGVTFNGITAAREYGGVANSFTKIDEIMA